MQSSEDPPPSISQPGKTYTTDELAQVIAAFRARFGSLSKLHSELALVSSEFDGVVRHATDPLQEMADLLEVVLQSLLQLTHLVNPITLPLHVTEDGRLLTQTFKEVAVFVTDIRGFTELTESVTRLWGIDIFQLLSYCYFPHITEILERHGCHYLNCTGDGLLILAPGKKSAEGKQMLSCLDNAVLCAMDMTILTNSIAETWEKLGLVQSTGCPHETGLGLASGDVEVGDPFVPDQAFRGPCVHFDEILRGVLGERMPYFQLRHDFTWRVRGVHALSPVINRACRLQDLDKLALDHTCMMTASDVAKLCPLLRAWFEPVGTMSLKGIGEVEVFGFQRFALIAVPELEQKCVDYYAGLEKF